MPIGYIVGKQYRLDYNYDRYAALDVWKRLVREAMSREISVEIKYSHIGRNYMCEAKHLTKFEKSGNYYFISLSLKHDSSPLGALVLALQDAFFTKEMPGYDDLMSVLFLEAEITLLGMAWDDAVAREKRQSEKISKALDALADCLRRFTLVEPLSADPSDVAAAHWENIQSGAIEYPQPIPAAPDEDDDL